MPRSVLVAAAIVLAGAGLFAAAWTAAAPMTNEDVVRMVASHRPTIEILEAIRTSPTTAFDLDPDVVVELRRAHVPDAVIAAMKDKQRLATPPAPKEPVASGTVEIVFEKDPGGDLSKSTAVTLARDWNDRPISLGFFVVCVDPLHVPDLWDAKNPLSVRFQRHRLHWFTDATRPWKQNRKRGTVFLVLPERERFDLDEGWHELRLGIAGRVGDDPWSPGTGAEARVNVRPGETARIFVRLKTRRIGWLHQYEVAEPWISCEIVRIEPPRTGTGAERDATLP